MNRIRRILRHLAGRRGILLILTLGSAIGFAVFRDASVAAILGAIAFLGLWGLLLLISATASRLHSELRELRREMESGALASAQSTGNRGSAGEPREPRTFSKDTIERMRVARGLLEAHRSSATAPVITVVIPCYNEEAFVAETIQSVKNQALEDWECIVVDDASTDNSLSVIWNAVDEDERFRVIRHRVNSGLSASRNTGLREARGELITFLDGDDLLLSESLLDRYLKFMAVREDPHVAGTFCGVINAPEDARLADFPSHRDWSKNSRDLKTFDLMSAQGECPFAAHSPLLRTSLLRSIGGFDESIFGGAEDWDLWLRLMRNGYIFVPATYRTAIYRQKLGSMIRTRTADHAETSSELIRRAFSKADPDALRAPSPTPMPEPVGFYEEGIALAKRLLRFAAAALVRDQREAAERIVSLLPDLPEVIVRRHVSLDREFYRGAARALGYTGKESSELKAAMSHLRELFDEIVSKSFATPEPPAPASKRRFEVLLVPQHSGQLEDMLADLPEVGGSVAILNLDREGGDQGVRTHLPSNAELLTLNQLVLEQPRIDHAVVGGVRDSFVESVIEILKGRGIGITEVEGELDQIIDLDAAHDSGAADTLITVENSPEVDQKGISIGLGAFDWAAITQEEDFGTQFDASALAEFKDRHKGERVVIIGNGPSLNELDLRLLKDEKTFAVNAIFLARERMGFDPSYYVVEDTAVMADNLSEIQAYEAGHKFFPSIYRHLIGEQPNVSYFMMNRGFYSQDSPNFCRPRFATEVSQQVFCGQSVTVINLQLAYHLGFSEVVLIGMDFSYVVPEDADVKGNLITSRGDDPNHFHPDYFGKGKVWKDPKLDRVLACYAVAKEVYESDGRRIVNATVGGNLELFERVNYNEYFGS